jgi:non-specific serine/threonine protein kinase
VVRFRKEGDDWTIGQRGAVFRLRDTSGLLDLALLLREPAREFLAADLVRAARRADGAPDAERQVGDRGDAGDALDRAARRAYKEDLDALRDEIEDARATNDSGRLAKLQRERDMLIGELTRGFGFGGKGRKVGSAVERGRLNVTRAIKAAVTKIGHNDRSLAHYLRTTIRTGTFCWYAPDDRIPTTWRF